MLIKLSELLPAFRPVSRRKKSFAELCHIEPKLAALSARIPELMPAGDFDWRRWSAIKQQMSALVGWEAKCPYITGCDDYEMAYAALIEEAYRAAERASRVEGNSLTKEAQNV